jgi:hypothetical protein
MGTMTPLNLSPQQYAPAPNYSYELVYNKCKQLSMLHDFNNASDLCHVKDVIYFKNVGISSTFIIPNDPMYRWIKW